MTTWWRVPEEEQRGGATRVYRPDGHPLPPARGREGFTLHADGRFDFLGSGRADRPVATAGRWSAVDGRIVAEVAGQRLELTVVGETPDRLEVEWSQTTA